MQNQIVVYSRPIANTAKKRKANKFRLFVRGVCVFWAIACLAIAFGYLIYAIGQALMAALPYLAIAVTAVGIATAFAGLYHFCHEHHG